MIVVACFPRKVGTGVILGGNRAQAQRSDILAPRQFGLGQHLRPGEQVIPANSGATWRPPLIAAT